MKSIKKSTKAVVARGRDTAMRVGKVTKAAAVAGAKAGAAAAIAAGTVAAEKQWKETSPATARKRVRNGALALLAGAALVGVAGAAIANSRRLKRAT